MTAQGAPDRRETIALCDRLASYGEAEAAPLDLMLRVGSDALRRFQTDPDVLSAVGRMFLVGRAFRDAERALRAAVRVAPEHPQAHRLLGEVLLREGDPVAAHRALARAVASGMNDPWTRTWVSRALDYAELLPELGREGVQSDVERVLGAPGASSDARDDGDRRSAPFEGAAGDRGLKLRDEDRVSAVPSSSPASRPHGRKSRRSSAPGGARLQAVTPMDPGLLSPDDPRVERPEPSAARFEVVDLPMPVADAVVPARGPRRRSASNQGESRLAPPQERIAPRPPPLPQLDDMSMFEEPPEPPPRARSEVRPPPLPPEEIARARASHADPGRMTPSRMTPSRPTPADPGRMTPSRMTPSRPTPADPGRMTPSRMTPADPGRMTPSRMTPADPARMTPSRPAPASLSGATATPHAPEAPEKPARKSRWRRAIYAGGIAAVLVASVGIGRALWLKNQSAKLRTRTAEVAAFLRDGGPSGVASAEAGLRALAAVDAKGRTVAIETTHVRMMALIDVDPTQVQALSDAITAARTAGARPSDLAPAELIRAALLGDGSVTAEMLRQFDEDPGCAKNAFYQLAAGVALELSDAALAIERYRTVLSIEPDFFSAEARLVRLLALEGAVAEAKTRVVAFIGKKPGSNEAAALSLYMRAFEPGARPSAEDALDPANVHRPLRAVVRAASAKGDEKALATALSEADAAPIAVFCGEAALAAGHLATAREAGTRAIEMAPAYAPAYGLTARVALLTGRFEEARQSAQKATPEAQAEVMSLVAYESLDLLGLRDLAGARAAGPMSDPIAAAARRLAGQKPFEPAEIQSLAASGILWADIVAADAALDRGDLALARSIVERWPAPEKHPVRSLRLGRLLRYEGKFEAARSALKSATATLPARIEQALVAAELPAVRASIGAQMAGSARPEERWAGAYLLARENKPVPARLAFKGLPWPDGSTPLLTRILTMLALAELRSVPANAPFVPTLAPWGTNPDLARATAPKTAAPAHDGAPGGGGEDPY